MLCDRIHDLEAGKTREVTIIGAEGGAMFEGNGSEMRIIDHVRCCLRVDQKLAEGNPMTMARANHLYV